VLFAVLSKAARRVAFQWIAKSKVRAIFFDTLVDSSVRENHTVDHYCDLLRPLGIEARGVAPALNLPAWAEKKAEQLLQETGCGEPFAIVHPGTARLEKFWVPERWAAVVDHVTSVLKMPCLLTAGSDPMEQTHIEKIKAALNSPLLRKASVIATPAQLAKTREPIVHDLTGRLDLLTLGALAKRARLFLSVDCGPMHLASAFGTPQVALFGPTNPFHWRPRHDHAVVVQAGEPDTGDALKPHHAAAPMEELSTARVIGAIKTLLSR
jgi:ADP-heptose:LPS heptosyltransferase